MTKKTENIIKSQKIKLAKELALDSRRVKVISTEAEAVVVRVVMPNGTTKTYTLPQIAT